MAEPGGRAVEHTVTLPVTASGNMIGVKPLFTGHSLGDGANATSMSWWSRRTAAAVAQSGLHYELLRVETHYQCYKRDNEWNFEPVKKTDARRRRQHRRGAGQARPHFAAGEFGPLPARSLGRIRTAP